jgi:beta-galactosidase
MKSSSCVELHSGSFWINGRPIILLTSSLFYFRIPAAEWRSRLRILRSLGYNAIDVYFPWNFHELAPGQWDFSGERDAAAFLQQAKEEGLWVVARPGPYICSEWDGGALPAYLFTEPGIHVRDNSPRYMESVLVWYSRIMPLLATNQVDTGGTIVLVQLENELDFYDCTSRREMMAALRDSALSHGITVPLIACSGQGDIHAATGDVEGIVPACNVYFESQDPKIEARIRHYDGLLRQMGYPVCITETNRSHTDLRRLIAGGAKLVGPYLQTGGTDFGFTTSVTNWGDPLAFMTSHYDFGGMITPGGKVRPEGCEAILLSKMLAALGGSMALSAPVATPPLPVQGVAGQGLALNGGGWLVGLPNPGKEAKQVVLGDGDGVFPQKIELIIEPNTCPFALLDYPLLPWKIDGKIAYSTAELVECIQQENTVELIFSVEKAAELRINWTAGALGNNMGWQVEHLSEGLRLWVDGSLPAALELYDPQGHRLMIKAEDRASVGDLKNAGIEDWEIISTIQAPQEFEQPLADWRLESIDPCNQDWFAGAKACSSSVLHLEQNGIYRGLGWYRTGWPERDHLQGLLIQSGGDVLSLYTGGHFIGTFVPGGGDAYVPLPEEVHVSVKAELVVRAEIWGHANFDDHRLPGLRINSMRGIKGLAGIFHQENLTPNWFYQHGSQASVQQVDPSWPLIYFGGWSTTNEPALGVYYKEVSFAKDLDTRVLHVPGLQVNAQVLLDGRSVGSVNPFSPYLDISNFSQPGETALIAIIVEQAFRRPAGQVILYQGEALKNWSVAGWDDSRLAGKAAEAGLGAKEIALPLPLPSGEMAWLSAHLPLSKAWEQGWGLKFIGQGLKVTAWIGQHLVGRIWLPSPMRPRMAAGPDDRMVLPAQWLREEGGQIYLLLESVTSGAAGELVDLKFTADI